MVVKIISGGQTGADQGGLEAGKALGLETGGTAPQRYITELGTSLKLRDVYGLTEGEYDRKVYPKRTKLNVRNSDATVIFGSVGSPGTLLTLRLCRSSGKPVLLNPTLSNFVLAVKELSVKVLNVAGNRESRNPGLQGRVKSFLIEALQEVH